MGEEHTRLELEIGMNGLLVDRFLCMQCPLMNRKTMSLLVTDPINMKWLCHYCRRSTKVSGESL